VDGRRLWAVVVLVVAGSVLLHGVTATPAMRWLDREREAAARRRSTGGHDQEVESTPV
jgi:sodium/hydrogen antiporter